MPIKVDGCAMVTSPSGKGVVVIGGWDHDKLNFSNILLELKGSSMEWVPLKQTLSRSGLSGLVAIPIPEELNALTLDNFNVDEDGSDVEEEDEDEDDDGDEDDDEDDYEADDEDDDDDGDEYFFKQE